jgi:hypothetical protein
MAFPLVIADTGLRRGEAAKGSWRPTPTPCMRGACARLGGPVAHGARRAAQLLPPALRQPPLPARFLPVRQWVLSLPIPLRLLLAPHDGQKPRRCQLKATSLSCPQSPQRRRCQAVRQDAAIEQGVELVLARSAASWLRRRLRSRRRRSWRAAAPDGTAWSARGGDARSGPARHPAPSGCSSCSRACDLGLSQSAQRAAVALWPAARPRAT